MNQSPEEILAQDPVLAKLIQRFGKITAAPHEDIYVALLSAIVSQQLSVKVAKVIFNRFRNLFPEQYPAPELVHALPDEALRSIGLSGQKLNYVRHVAAFKQEGKLEYQLLNQLDEEALIRHLTQVKGVGRWTAEMILMFTLNRPDVLPLDDLGIQKAMQRHYGLPETGKALKTRMEAIATSWKPYRTLACKYLWRSLDNA